MKSERSITKTYLRWRKTPPTLRSLLPGFLLLWTILLLLTAVLVAIAYALPHVLDLRWLAVFVVGILVGGIARDIGWARRSISSWPFLSRLLDWSQVERLASGSELPAADASESPLSAKPRYAHAARIGLVSGVALLLALLGTDYMLLRSNDPRPGNPQTSVILYTTTWCPYCKALRRHLQASGIPYADRDVEQSVAASYAHRAVGGRGVPVIVIGQEVVHGYDPVKLDAVLRRAGYHPAATTHGTSETGTDGS